MRWFHPMILAAVLATGCSTAADGGDDTAAHTAGEAVTPRTSALSWIDAPYAQLAVAGRVTAPALAEDDALTLRLQAWVDRVHGKIAALARAEGKALDAPKPIVRVLPSTVPNAWVSRVTACLPYDVVTESGFVIIPAQPQFADECVRATNWSSLPTSSFADAINERLAAERVSPGTCHVRAEARSFVMEGMNCDGHWGAFRLPATSRVIFYTTALLAAQKDEAGMVGALVHELGHYYRAHNSVPFRSYWYEQQEQPTAGRPTPTADDPALEELAREHGVPNDEEAPVLRIDGQRLNARLTMSVAGPVAEALAAVKAVTATDFACADAEARSREPWRAEFVPGATEVSDAARQGYLAYESALLTCGDGLRVARAVGANAIQAGAIPKDVGARVDQPLGTALREASDRAAEKDRRLLEWTRALSQRHVSRYTHEQEADEFSLEWAAKIGVAPKQILDADIALMEAKYGKDPARFDRVDGIPYETCRALYESGFERRNADGTRSTVFVPIGDALDDHHGKCYRVFNLVREARAHGYEVAAEPPPPGDWEALRRAAEDLTAALDSEQHADAPPGAFPVERLRIVDGI